MMSNQLASISDCRRHVHQQFLYRAMFFLNLRSWRLVHALVLLIAHYRRIICCCRNKWRFLFFQLDSHTTDRRYRHGLTKPVSNSIRTDESSDFTPNSRPGFSVLCSSSFCLLSSEQSQMIAVQPEIYLTSQRWLLHRATWSETEAPTQLPSHRRNLTSIVYRQATSFVEVPTARVVRSSVMFCLFANIDMLLFLHDCGSQWEVHNMTKSA